MTEATVQPGVSRATIMQKGFNVYREVSDASVLEEAQHLLVENFPFAVEPISPNEVRLPMRLDVVGKFETARALIQAAGAGPVKTAVVMEQVQELLADEIKSPLDVHSNSFNVGLYKTKRSKGLISLRFNDGKARRAMPRSQITAIIDEISGRDYDWQGNFRYMIPVARLIDKAATVDIRDFRMADTLAVPLSELIFAKKTK